MKKVLILYNYLFHYRIPIWNILAKEYDLTVMYSYPAKAELIKQCNFKTKYLPVKQVGKLVFHCVNLHLIAHSYDVVICDGQITFANFSLLGFMKRTYKLVYWCIGAPAGYNRTYGEGGRIYYFLNDFVHKRADAMIFYSQRAINLHIERGWSSKNLFVANNTVKVLELPYCKEGRDSLLFIGTLYLEKGVQQLLDAYKAAYEENPQILKLNIVGGGVQLKVIRKWIEDNGLGSNIILKGPIYDIKTKSEIFQKSIACISPLQAGLSVLESMGYGVPFITSENAITGGESFNIQHGTNGLLMRNMEELKDVILDISKNTSKYIEMGKSAYCHYWEYRKPQDMAQGIINAIEYTLK